MQVVYAFHTGKCFAVDDVRCSCGTPQERNGCCLNASFLGPLYSLLNLRIIEYNIEMAGPLEERVAFCSTVGQEDFRETKGLSQGAPGRKVI